MPRYCRTVLRALLNLATLAMVSAARHFSSLLSFPGASSNFTIVCKPTKRDHSWCLLTDRFTHLFPDRCGNRHCSFFFVRFTLTLSLARVINFKFPPAASPKILHHIAWRIWLFIAYSDESWSQILTTSLIHCSLKGWENVHSKLPSEKSQSLAPGTHLLDLQSPFWSAYSWRSPSGSSESRSVHGNQWRTMSRYGERIYTEKYHLNLYETQSVHTTPAWTRVWPSYSCDKRKWRQHVSPLKDWYFFLLRHTCTSGN